MIKKLSHQINIKKIYIKITDKYLYIYSNKVERIDNNYIKNGKVDNVEKFILYLKTKIEKNIIKRKYIFILDTLLNNSDLFVYNYVFSSLGILDYEIINDLDLIKNIVNEENIIVMNWSSSINYAYINNNEIVIYPFNTNVINSLNKKYILLVGDTPISKRITVPVYDMEFKENVIYNCL